MLLRKAQELILTHHPVIFNPLKRLCQGDIPFECARKGISVISSHTCLDKAKGGVNDVVASLLSLEDVSVWKRQTDCQGWKIA